MVVSRSRESTLLCSVYKEFIFLNIDRIHKLAAYTITGYGIPATISHALLDPPSSPLDWSFE
jgi:hypothetical protein